MPFTRPTLPELIKRNETDIKTGMGVTTLLRRSFLGVIARVIAGMAHMLFGFLEFLSIQFFPDTAEAEYLKRWGSIWGVFLKEATYAQFTVEVTGTNGTVIPLGTIFQRDDGFEYTSDSEQTIALGVALIPLTASTPGVGGNLELGDEIALQSPISGVTSNGIVGSIEIEAADEEDVETYRERIVFRIQNPPSGGAASDYITWAKEVAGVTRAWVLPLAFGPGTVAVAAVNDEDDPISLSPAKITELEEYIDERRPVTANVTVFTPTLVPMTLSIELRPNTTAVQEAVEAELKDLLFREGSLAGAYKSPSENYDGVILLSHIREAVSLAVGEEDHNILLINGVTPADVTPNDGELVTLGTITWSNL